MSSIDSGLLDPSSERLLADAELPGDPSDHSQQGPA